MTYVVHVGPDRHSTGGMATVLREYERMHWRGAPLVAEFWATWSPSARLWGLTNLLAAVLNTARKRRSIDVVHVHLSEGGSFLREGFLLFFTRFCGLRSCLSLHGARFEEFAKRWPRLVRAVLQQADVIVVLGPKSAEFTKQLSPRSIVKLIRNPCCMDDVKVSKGKPRDHTILFAGEVGPRKGVDRLMSAWPRVLEAFPDAVLRICGPLVDAAAPPQGRGVIYLGELDRHDVQSELATTWASCLPSRREVLPMFIIESLAAGVPVVATDAGEVASLAESGGVSVVPQSEGVIESLASALIDVLSSWNIRQSRGAAARTWCCSGVASEVISRQLGELYEEMLSGAVVTQ